MARLHKKKDHYYAVFYDPDRRPQRKWVPLRTTDKRAATIKLGAMDREFLVGEYDPWRDRAPDAGLTLSGAVDEYLASKDDRREKTRRADRSVLALFASTLRPHALLTRVTAADVKRFVHRPDRAASTRATYFVRLRAFFAWCAERSLLKEDPAAYLIAPKPSGARRSTSPTRSTRGSSGSSRGEGAEAAGSSNSRARGGSPTWCG